MFEKDPENLSGRGHPSWLSILIKKFELILLNLQEEMREDEIAQNKKNIDKISTVISSSKDSLINDDKKSVKSEFNNQIPKSSTSPERTAVRTNKFVFSIGKFSAFLSCCVVGLISCNMEEREAFIVVSFVYLLYHY